MYPDEEFQKLVSEIKKSGKPRKIKINTLLKHFGVKKRGKNVIGWIIYEFDKNGLILDPKFKDYYISAMIEIKPKPKVPARNSSNNAVELGLSNDSIPRLRILDSANRKPISVKRDDELKVAISLMMMNDFSQLPVMQGERTVEGVISWKSIGEASNIGKDCKLVKDCMNKEIEILKNDISLLKAVKIINAKEYVLVQNKQNLICGLVTTTDIGEQFISISEPFLLLEQIENHIRNLLDNKFNKSQLKAIKNPDDEDRQVNYISDLTFGEYVRIFENPKYWKILDLNLDKKIFCERLNKVRLIRNDVMHFHPDGIEETDLEYLRQTNNFFSKLG